MQHTGERPLEEITLQIYPEGASHFELYEDDGRSNAYRRGAHALTRVECEAQPGRIAVRIGMPSGDRSVVPPGRRYLRRLHVDRPVAVAGVAVREQMRDAVVGWWMDEDGFLCVRPPAGLALNLVVSAAAG